MLLAHEKQGFRGLKGLPVKLGILSRLMVPVGNVRSGGAGFGG